jgi:hypothetical protein
MRHDIVSDEQEVRDAMRAFDTAQMLLGTGRAASRRVIGNVEVGWYGSEIDPNRGSMAYVRAGSPLEDFIGDVVQVSHVRGGTQHMLLAYVMGAADVPYELHLNRVIFARLDMLSEEFLHCSVRVFE